MKRFSILTYLLLAPMAASVAQTTPTREAAPEESSRDVLVPGEAQARPVRTNPAQVTLTEDSLSTTDLVRVEFINNIIVDDDNQGPLDAPLASHNRALVMSDGRVVAFSGTSIFKTYNSIETYREEFYYSVHDVFPVTEQSGYLAVVDLPRLSTDTLNISYDISSECRPTFLGSSQILEAPQGCSTQSLTNGQTNNYATREAGTKTEAVSGDTRHHYTDCQFTSGTLGPYSYQINRRFAIAELICPTISTSTHTDRVSGVGIHLQHALHIDYQRQGIPSTSIRFSTPFNATIWRLPGGSFPNGTVTDPRTTTGYSEFATAGTLRRSGTLSRNLEYANARVDVIYTGAADDRLMFCALGFPFGTMNPPGSTATRISAASTLRHGSTDLVTFTSSTSCGYHLDIENGHLVYVVPGRAQLFSFNLQDDGQLRYRAPITAPSFNLVRTAARGSLRSVFPSFFLDDIRVK